MTSKIENKTEAAVEVIELQPDFKLAIALIMVGVTSIWLKPILGSIVTVIGLFLLVQTFRIRLCFSPKALDVYNGGNLIRSFPYQEWSNWRIFWQPLPILFYFREVNSIHFLPVLFDSQALLTCLEKYCPRI